MNALDKLNQESQPKYKWTLMASKNTQTMLKYSAEWTMIDAPLVLKFPNSTHLCWPGTWNNTPGVSSTNKITGTKTGPQFSIECDYFFDPNSTKHSNIFNCMERLLIGKVYI